MNFCQTAPFVAKPHLTSVVDSVFFSERLAQKGADVTACDIGESMVAQTAARARCRALVADALDLTGKFGRESFDLVVSSECIEHTPDPREAVRQMTQVLRPGGYLVLSTPNIAWWPIVKTASLLKLRPFDGLENFSSFRGLRNVMNTSGVTVLQEKGLHLFPFQLGLHRLSRWADDNLQPLRSLMINLCILGVKDARSSGVTE